MKKKVAIVTLFDERNIGNRLQNIALQNVIERYGVKVTTINNYYTQNKSLKYQIELFIKNCLNKMGYKKYHSECCRQSKLKYRRKACKNFNKNNLSQVLKMKNKQAFLYDWSDYDVVIAGSDQIWHKWRDDVDELSFYYLQFVPYDKRVAYAASFGFEEFPIQDIEKHREGLNGMKAITCRESSGCALVKNLINRDVIRVLDPTLLMTADEWKEIEKQAIINMNNKEKYAFSFFLGDITEEYRNHIDYIMKENEIDVLLNFDDEAFHKYGPCEFLYLIDHAQYVFTDSFHCSVFSVVFDKKFVAFKRVQYGFEKMFGRIEDLLASTGKLKYVYGETHKKETNDFAELYQQSIQYIENVLEISE